MLPSERFLFRAFVISLLIHFAVFGLWKYGKTQGWWRNLQTPAWLQLTPKKIPILVKKIVPLRPSPPPQLVFVDVDPALAVADPPKAPKFYSSDNSLAGNPEPKNNSPDPEIRGKQEKTLKTTENGRPKPQPLQPTPPQPETPKTVENKPPPQKTYTPGDLATAKPVEKPQERQNPPLQDPSTEPQTEPVHQRPRTIADAKAERGMLGEKTHQSGGVRRLSLDSSLEAMKTSYGDYDRDFIDAVQARWFQLLEKTATVPGKVVLEFRLHANGRISDMNPVTNEVGELLGIICQQAINDPSPFRPWPMEMRREIGKDYRDITFTFYYLNE
jgi:hypothetical protein